MKIEEFELERNEEGVQVSMTIALETNVRFKVPKSLGSLEVVRGADVDEEGKLKGMVEFDKLWIETKHIDNFTDARRAVTEIRGLIREISLAERAVMDTCLLIENYIRKELQEYLTKEEKDEKEEEK